MQTNQLTVEQEEEIAFYESGLSAHGCLEKLDQYAKDSIQRYGRILVEKQKQKFIDGFQGCCYACEPVGMLNQDLSEVVESLYEIVEHIQTEAKRSALVSVNSPLYEKIIKALDLYTEKAKTP